MPTNKLLANHVGVLPWLMFLLAVPPSLSHSAEIGARQPPEEEAGAAGSVTGDPLLDKLYGCAAAVHIANAMGETVEGKPFGSYEYFDWFPSGRSYTASFGENSDTYDSIRRAKTREPAMGEDGCERFRWVASSVVRKGERIDIGDLARTIQHDIDPEKFGYLIGWQDQFLYYSIILGLPPQQVGAFASWPGFIGTDKMLGAAVGMLNAGNPTQAAADARQLGLLKDVPSGDGNWALDVCAAHAAALAEAFRPETSLQRIIDTALYQLSPAVRREVQQNLDFARSVGQWRELGPYYADKYAGKPISRAEEVISRGLSCLLLAKGEPQQAILYSANLGRDTDCCCYMAGTLAAAFRGIGSVPAAWVEAVNRQIETCPFSNNRRNSWENALGFYRTIKGLPAEASLEQLVREHLKMPPHAPLTEQDYQRVISLEGNGRQLSNLEGIERLANLQWLNLGGNRIEDLSPLAGLARLRYLDLSNNRIKDLSPLAGLTQLTELLLDGNQIADVAPLGPLSDLRRLNLSSNDLADLSPLAGLTKLTSFFVAGNRVRRLDALAGSISTLVVLNANDNQIDGVEPLARGVSLVGLYLQNNQLEQLKPLADLQSRIKCLDVSGNRIADLAPLQPLATLLQLDARSNHIRTAEPLASLEHLSYLDLRDNQLEDLSPAGGLKYLKVLYLQGNATNQYESLSDIRDQLLLKDF